jgi:hypothetical protein
MANSRYAGFTRGFKQEQTELPPDLEQVVNDAEADHNRPHIESHEEFEWRIGEGPDPKQF